MFILILIAASQNIIQKAPAYIGQNKEETPQTKRKKCYDTLCISVHRDEGSEEREGGKEKNLNTNTNFDGFV